jgi:hypothetical protein
MTITKQMVEAAVPANLKNSISQNLVDTLNNLALDPMVADNIRENFISYTGVLKDGKFKTEDYLSAVMYVSFKLMGQSNKDAYARTFPQRYATLISKGFSEKDISAYVSAYNKGKLVNLILEQTLVPVWVLNQHLYQQALNVQARLMTTANSEKVQTDAANSLLTHLKKPEAQNFQISMDVKESSGMNEMREAMRKMAERQQQMIEAGVSTLEITATPIVERGDKSENASAN